MYICVYVCIYIYICVCIIHLYYMWVIWALNHSSNATGNLCLSNTHVMVVHHHSQEVRGCSICSLDGRDPWIHIVTWMIHGWLMNNSWMIKEWSMFLFVLLYLFYTWKTCHWCIEAVLICLVRCQNQKTRSPVKSYGNTFSQQRYGSSVQIWRNTHQISYPNVFFLLQRIHLVLPIKTTWAPLTSTEHLKMMKSSTSLLGISIWPITPSWMTQQKKAAMTRKTQNGVVQKLGNLRSSTVWNKSWHET